MPKPASGEVRYFGGVWSARVRLQGGERDSFAMPWCKSEAPAKARARLLADIARRLTLANVDAERVRTVIGRAAVAAADRELRELQSIVEELAGGQVRIAGLKRAPTFQELGERWTSGQLAKQFPDQIRAKRSVEDDEQRLRMYIYPQIGGIPIDRVSLDDCERVMRTLPSTLATATRRNVGQLVTRLMSIAVYPLRLVPQSPVPRGFLPRARQRLALASLYPSEDARLMACSSVPLAYRVLWGFLMREGMRLGEALALTWADLDLARGAVRLDRNKTNDPRAWALGPGVASALSALRERYRVGALSTDRVFVGPSGQPIVASGALGLPPLLRAHLKQVGLEAERPELFESTDERRQLRVHDLRGTFVTVNLANGKSEAWIADRTGHRSSQMISHYKRTARTFAELHTGDFEPLDVAIPELAIAPGLPRDASNLLKSLASPAGFENRLPLAQAFETTENSVISHAAEPRSSAIVGATGQSRGNQSAPAEPPTAPGQAELSAPIEPPAIPALTTAVDLLAPAQVAPEPPSATPEPADPLEAALAAAVTAATVAGRWDVVGALAEQLVRLRAARQPTASERAPCAPSDDGGVVLELDPHRRRSR